ncbi:MAG: cell envelope integrity protein CreD [Treponema sp.]
MQTKKESLSGQMTWVKPAVIFILLLVMLIPIQFVKHLVSDRKDYKFKAEMSIMVPLGGQPVIQGLAVAVPYRKERKKDEEIETYYIIEIPENYSLNAKIDPYYLSRGIFSVPVFSGTLEVAAEFPSFRTARLNIPERDILYKDAVLIVGLRNKKTLTARPALTVNGKKLSEAEAVANTSTPFENPVFYNLPEDMLRSGFSLAGTLNIQGGQSLSLSPTAEESVFTIESSWAAPKFSGGWLPTKRTVGKDGFQAEWNISGLSTNVLPMWKTEERSDSDSYSYYSSRIPSEVRIDFLTPVNNYSEITRCVQYALLFLACPFLTIFLCELWSARRIHPVQYFLIGMADVLFYLLLLSISEHLSFNWSYFITAFTVSLVVLLYSAAIFKNFKWGVMLFSVQEIAYFLLFGILQSEDYALLIGSVGIFLVLVLIMFLTRKVDWYGKMQAPALIRTASAVLDAGADELYRDIRIDIKKHSAPPRRDDADTAPRGEDAPENE